MKFGGTSVADAERHPQRRAGGSSRARGRQPRRRGALRARHDDRPADRDGRRDLLRAGRRARWTCCCRPASASPARCARWRSTTSGSRRSRCRARRPGSSPTPRTRRRGSSTSAPTASARRSTTASIVLVAGFQGVSDGQRRHDARPRRLGHDRRRARGRDRAPTSARSTPTSPASSPPTRAIVPDARKLDRVVSFEEMLEMAASGAKVLQLRSVEYARNHGVRHPRAIQLRRGARYARVARRAAPWNNPSSLPSPTRPSRRAITLHRRPGQARASPAGSSTRSPRRTATST